MKEFFGLNSITCSNDEQAACLLINAGADVNHKNTLGFTPVEVAATIGHCRILKLLVKHPKIHLDSQVSCCDGNAERVHPKNWGSSWDLDLNIP